MTMPFSDDYDRDQPLIEAIQQGDKFAFEDFVRRHESWIRSVVFGVLGQRDAVDDVVQQIWAAVWQRISGLRDSRRWRPWLYSLSRNAALDAGRQVTRRREQMRSLAAEAAVRPRQQVDRSCDDADVSERHAVALDAIRALPALYREPFVLRHVNGWSYKEIADVMGIPVDTVETRLVRARRRLRERLLIDKR